jgi:hypothetical protein
VNKEKSAVKGPKPSAALAALDLIAEQFSRLLIGKASRKSDRERHVNVCRNQLIIAVVKTQDRKEAEALTAKHVDTSDRILLVTDVTWRHKN